MSDTKLDSEVNSIHESDNEDGSISDVNIGSMVSIKSDGIVTADDDSDEYVIPDMISCYANKRETAKEAVNSNEKTEKCDQIDSSIVSTKWPTLQILPGGVIKHGYEGAEKKKECVKSNSENVNDSSVSPLYSCAKCSQSFTYLYCLVQHVRWHEIEKKIQLSALPNVPKDHEYISKNKRKVNSVINSCKLPKTL